MKILILGGTRFFGVHTVTSLLRAGHEVTIATRGNISHKFGDTVRHVTLDRTDPASMKKALAGKHFDVLIDKSAYSSLDIKNAVETLSFGKYIFTSSTAVYEPKRINTTETDFDPAAKKFVWCSRPDLPYDEGKRNAERALWQNYPDINFLAVRLPFVIGEDDYTQRLLFYVRHTVENIPMHIDNIDRQMGFISSREAGEFMSFLAGSDMTGAVNGCSGGTVSLREIIRYTEDKTGTQAVISETGDPAPYNGEPEYSINTEKAQTAGYRFSQVSDYLYPLLDHYIELTSEAPAKP